MKACANYEGADAADWQRQLTADMFLAEGYDKRCKQLV